MREWITLARRTKTLALVTLELMRRHFDDRRSARKIARLNQIIGTQLAQTAADICDEVTLMILDVEDYLASVAEIEAAFAMPCAEGH